MFTKATLSSIPFYVIQDLADASSTSVEHWVEQFCGTKATKLRQWSAKLEKERLFQDNEIQDALLRYCSTDVEKERYKPFIDLLSRVVLKGRELLDLAGPEGNTYPVDNIAFFNNSNRPIETIREHNGIAAECRPDVIMLRKNAIPAEKMKANWTDVLTWWELEVCEVLAELLSDAMVTRGLPKLPKHGSKAPEGTVQSSSNTDLTTVSLATVFVFIATQPCSLDWQQYCTSHERF